jgi:hypothetical protein
VQLFLTLLARWTNFNRILFLDKVALVLGPKLTVFDLERKAWCTKLTIDDNISAVLFTKSGNVLFVATAKHIHVCLTALFDAEFGTLPIPFYIGRSIYGKQRC